MTPTDPQERANTTDAAEVLRAHIPVPARVGYVVCTCTRQEWMTGTGYIEHLAAALAAASLLRQDPPQVAGEDVERVARAWCTTCQARSKPVRCYVNGSPCTDPWHDDRPAGDVERVARAIYEQHADEAAGAGQSLDETWESADQYVRDAYTRDALAVLAALSARPVGARCPGCGGIGGHSPVHVRYGNGGGGNRPCPVEAQEVERLRAEEDRWRDAALIGLSAENAALARAKAAEAVIERVRTWYDENRAAMTEDIDHVGRHDPRWKYLNDLRALLAAASEGAPGSGEQTPTVTAAGKKLDPLAFVWPSGTRSMFTHGDGQALRFAPRAEYEQDPARYPLSRSSAHAPHMTAADLPVDPARHDETEAGR